MNDDEYGLRPIGQIGSGDVRSGKVVPQRDSEFVLDLRMRKTDRHAR
jgi:hypothetical protein